MSTLSPNWVLGYRPALLPHKTGAVALSVATAVFFFLSTTHILVSVLGVQYIDDLHCNVSFGQSCFLVHAREVPVSQAKKASAYLGTREQWFGLFSRSAFQKDYTRFPMGLLCKT